MIQFGDFLGNKLCTYRGQNVQAVKKSFDPCARLSEFAVVSTFQSRLPGLTLQFAEDVVSQDELLSKQAQEWKHRLEDICAANVHGSAQAPISKLDSSSFAHVAE